MDPKCPEPEPEPEDPIVKNGAIALFNHYYAALLRDVKAHGVGRGAIKKFYHRFDHADASHAAKWSEWTAPLVKRLASESEDADAVLADETLAEDTLLFEGIYLEQVLSSGVPRGALVQALLSLAVAARLHEIGASDDAVLDARRRLQKAASASASAAGGDTREQGDEEGGEGVAEESGDERIDALVRAAVASAALHAPPPLPPGVAEQLRKLEDTKIGRMAREISESLGPNAINDPASLAAVIGKVGGAMQAKMQNGEINHGELLSEAMGMIGSLPSLFQAAAGASGGKGMPEMPAGMPDMAAMLKTMMSGFGGLAASAGTAQAPARGATSERESSARSRLAAKLASRKSQN